MDAVGHLRGEPTILMIAHRLTTVAGCDRVVTLRDGSLDASGTYDELAAGQAPLPVSFRA